MTKDEAFSDAEKKHFALMDSIVTFQQHGFDSLLAIPSPRKGEKTQGDKIGHIQECEQRALNLLSQLSDYAASLQNYETILSQQGV
jgi:hypothetical protein